MVIKENTPIIFVISLILLLVAGAVVATVFVLNMAFETMGWHVTYPMRTAFVYVIAGIYSAVVALKVVASFEDDD